MKLDASTAELLNLMANAERPPISTLDAKAARAMNDPLAEASEHRPEDVDRTNDRGIETAAGSIPARIYWPLGFSAPTPLLVYYHGGGGVIGTLDSYDSVCRTLANSSGCITISVDYRLGPENRFPASFEDALAAFDWSTDNAAGLGADPDRIAVAGDSCGGGLAAAVAQETRDRDIRPSFQLLIYPALDARRSGTSYPSYTENSEGYFLDHALIDWYQKNYLATNQDLSDPRLSPACSKNLSNLPPAQIITAGFDPLRDEGAAYASALAAAGVRVDYRCYDSTIHGFVSMGRFIPFAVEALRYCGATLKSAV